MKIQLKPKKLFLLTMIWLLLVLVGWASLSGLFRNGQRSKVEAATSSTINFQARLLTNTGALVPDGYYNVQFNLYNVSSGGSSEWSETYYDSNGVTAGNDNRVRVVNGYLSVYLGSQTAFPGTINWDQEQWLTLNIGGTTQTATPTWDGEMTPRLKLSATPYALTAGSLQATSGANALKLNLASPTANVTYTLQSAAAGSYDICTTATVCTGYAAASGSSSYIQNGTSVQTSANFNIDGSGTIGTALNLTGNTTSLNISGAPAASTTSSLIQIGNAIAGGNASGTYIGLNAPSSGPGSSANLIDLQVNGNSKFKIDTAGNVNANGNIVVNTNSLTNGAFSKSYTAGTGGVNVNDVVVMANDSGNARVIDTTTPRDVRVLGVAASTVSSGSTFTVRLLGSFQVTADTGAVAIGDQLVTSSTSGQVTVDNNATTGILGTALSSKSAGSSGLVSVFIHPIGGQSTPRFQNATDSTTAFQIQNNAGTSNLLVADTTTTRIGIGTASPNTTLSVYNGNESTTQTDLTQALNKGGINIVTDFTDTAYTPGLFWSTQDNNPTKPKAGIYMYEDSASGTSLLFGTSGTYSTGITNTALTLNSKGGAIFRNGSNDTTGFQIQNAIGTGLFTVNTSTGATLTTTLFIDTLGSANNNTVLCRNSSSQVATCSSSFVTGTSADYIQNGTSPQTANFNITGSGTVGGTFTANGQQFVIQPASSLTAGQTNISQTLTNASSSGGTVNGYNQAFTISNTVSSSTTNGINITLTDNASSIGNLNTGVNVTLNGSNSTQGDVGISSSVIRGLAIQGITSGSTGTSNGAKCNSVSGLGVGVCAGDSAGSNSGGGLYAYTGSRATTNIYDPQGSGVYGINQAGGTAGAFYTGVKGITTTNSAAAYTSMGVFGQAKGGAGASIYGGYFTLDSASSASAVGSALYASNSSTTANILQLQDNTTDVFVVADGGNVTAAGDVAIQGGDLTTTATTFNLLAGATTALNIGPGSTTAVSINLAGGAGATGCTVAGATGNLTCDGAIATNATTGTQGWWTRSGTTLSPVNAGDAITTSGNISTSGSGTITAGGILNANATGKTAIQIADSGAQSSGITIGGDTNLYRGAADTLQTDDSLLVRRGSLNAFQVQNAAGTNTVFNVDTLNALIAVQDASGATGNSSISFNNRAIFGYEGTNQNAYIQGASGKGIEFQTNGSTTNVASFSTTGQALFQNSANSSTAFQVQNAAGTSTLFNVDTTTSNLITNPSFEVDTSGWTTSGSGTGLAISRNTTAANVYHGIGSLQIVTASSAANTGASVTSFTSSITPGTYTLSFVARATTSFNTFNVTITGGGAPSCLTGQTLATGFQNYSCTFTSTTTNVTAINFITTTSTQRTIYLDAVQLITGSTNAPYNIGKLQLNGVITSPTVFQNVSDSTTALQVTTSDGSTKIFTVNTLNGEVAIGAPTTGNDELYVQSNSDVTIHGKNTGSANLLVLDNNSGNILTLNNAGQLQLATQGSTGGVQIGSDTQIYRTGTDMLGLGNGDSLRVYSSGGGQFLTLQSAATSNYLDVRNGVSGDWLAVGKVTTDTNQRFVLKVSGEMQWGDGTNTPDIILSRSGAGAINLQPTSGNNSQTAFTIKNGSGNTLLAFDNSLASGRLVVGGTGTSSEKIELYRNDTTTANHLYFTTHLGTDWSLGNDTGSNDFSIWNDTPGSNIVTLSGTNGSATFKNAADSTSGFLIQNTLNSTIFSVDTTDETVGIGTAAVNGKKLLIQTGQTGLVVNETSTNDILDLQQSGSNVVSVNNVGQLQLLTTGSTGGLIIGGDAQIYRSNASELSLGSNDSLVIPGGNLTVQNGSTAAFQVKDGSGNPYILANTSGATLSLGNTGVASTIQIGNTTGGVAQTIGIGNNATALSTSAITVGDLLGTSSTTIQGGTGASALSLQVGASGTLSIGTTVQTTTLNIGNASASTAVTIQGGTGASAVGIQVGASGTIKIGTTVQTTTLNIGNTSASTTVTINGGTGASAIALTPGVNGSVAIGAATGTGTITLGKSTGAETINIGNVATAAGSTHTISIGATNNASTGVTAITIGNSNSSTGVNTVTIKAGGSGGSAGPSVTLGATASTTAVCSSLATGTAPTAGTAYELRDCSGAPVADYAENYPVASDVGVGDVVSMGSQMVNTYGVDGANAGAPDWSHVIGQVPQLIKASQPYQANVIGIVSDNNNNFSSVGYNIKDADNPKPIALNGRVLVHVTTENGPIQTGDYLTSSGTIAGAAMKATQSGYVIGQALSSYSGSGTGEVMVFVKNFYYPGQSTSEYLQNGQDANFNNLSVTNATVNNLTANVATISQITSTNATITNLDVSGTATIGTLHITGNSVLDGLLTINSHIITGKTDEQAKLTTEVLDAAGKDINGNKDATCEIDGNDTSGTITLTTGTQDITDGTMCKISFIQPFTSVPRTIISALDKDSLQIGGFTSSTNNDFTLNLINVPDAHHVYKFNYWNPQ